MSKVYTIAFRMGVLFNILLWTMLNIISFHIAQSSFVERESSLFGFGSYSGFSWGFPFAMFRNYFFADEYLLVFNVIVYVICGFFFGFLFKFIWSKISRRRVELK